MEPDPLASAPRRVEVYLDQILTPLARRLSPFHRDELRRELREHLWARVDAYSELGQSEDEAVTEALRQFGGAEDFLRQWQREWMKTTPQLTLREMWAATRSALLLSIPALLMACIGSSVWQYHQTHELYVPWISYNFSYHHFYGFQFWPFPSYAASDWGSFSVDFVLLPIALGAAVGQRAPRHAGVGILAALAAEAVLSRFLLMLSPNVGRLFSNFFYQVFISSTSWLPTACLTAALTGWWTRRRKRVLA